MIYLARPLGSIGVILDGDCQMDGQHDQCSDTTAVEDCVLTNGNVCLARPSNWEVLESFLVGECQIDISYEQCSSKDEFVLLFTVSNGCSLSVHHSQQLA